MRALLLTFTTTDPGSRASCCCNKPRSAAASEGFVLTWSASRIGLLHSLSQQSCVSAASC